MPGVMLNVQNAEQSAELHLAANIEYPVSSNGTTEIVKL